MLHFCSIIDLIRGGGGHEELEGPADLDGGQDQGEQGEKG